MRLHTVVLQLEVARQPPAAIIILAAFCQCKLAIKAKVRSCVLNIEITTAIAMPFRRTPTLGSLFGFSSKSNICCDFRGFVLLLGTPFKQCLMEILQVLLW